MRAGPVQCVRVRRKEGDGLVTGAGLELRADLGGGCGGNGEYTGLMPGRASLAVALVEERALLLDILAGRKRRVRARPCNPAQFLDAAVLLS